MSKNSNSAIIIFVWFLIFYISIFLPKFERAQILQTISYSIFMYNIYKKSRFWSPKYDVQFAKFTKL